MVSSHAGQLIDQNRANSTTEDSDSISDVAIACAAATSFCILPVHDNSAHPLRIGRTGICRLCNSEEHMCLRVGASSHSPRCTASAKRSCRSNQVSVSHPDCKILPIR